jgi:RND family efflux transporter MFP subunit
LKCSQKRRQAETVIMKKKILRRTRSHPGAVLALAAICASPWLSGCHSDDKVRADSAANAAPVAVVKAERKDISSTLEIASEFQPFQEINVYAKVSGYIRKLHVDWGSHVKQGQLLAELEIPELEQQVQQDRAAAQRSSHDLSRAREEVTRAESAYTVAHLMYQRLADVQKTQPNLVAQQEVDEALGKDQEASAGVSAAKASLAAAEQAVIGAKAALAKDEALYAYSHITAPFEGVVTEISAYTGALLPAGTSSNKGDQSLCRLSQNNMLRLVIPLPERAVGDVQVGQTVAVQVSGANRTFDGKIVRFSDQIDRDTRTMHTEVDVPNPKYELVPGMYASVRIPLHTVKNALTVPVQAVQPSGEDRGTLLVVNEARKIEKRDVRLGLETSTDAEILSGLRENELVVFGTQSQFKAGQSVSPKLIEPSKAD